MSHIDADFVVSEKNFAITFLIFIVIFTVSVHVYNIPQLCDLLHLLLDFSTKNDLLDRTFYLKVNNHLLTFILFHTRMLLFFEEHKRCICVRIFFL